MANETNELLQRFVATPSESREFLRNPILRDDWVYATDGSILIRVPRVEDIDAAESDLPKRLAEIFDNPRGETFVDLPDLPPAEACTPCHGSGIAYKCKACKGAGWLDRGGEDYDCKSCVGSGQTGEGDETDKVPCSACNGTRIFLNQRVTVGNIFFARRYLEKIKSLPEVRFATPPDNTIPAYFSFDGGEGLLMPMIEYVGGVWVPVKRRKT